MASLGGIAHRKQQARKRWLAMVFRGGVVKGSAGASPQRVSVKFGASACARYLVSALFLALLFGSLKLRAQAPRESDVKAAFLFNFAQFVDWPADALPEPSTPLVIGVFGVNPFGDTLERIVRGESVHGHKVEVRYITRLADAAKVHVLFVASDQAGRWPELAELLRDKPVLTVSDIDRFTRHGGMIRFVNEQNRVHFYVNAEAAKEAGLSLSSKLLRLGKIVNSDGSK